MEEITISKFKATCLAVLERVRKTRRPVRVTRFGKPIAEIVATKGRRDRSHWLGAMVGTGRICGDIISPAIPKNDWDALRK